MNPKLIKWIGTLNALIGLLPVMQSNKILSFACDLQGKLPGKYISNCTICVLKKCSRTDKLREATAFIILWMFTDLHCLCLDLQKVIPNVEKKGVENKVNVPVIGWCDHFLLDRRKLHFASELSYTLPHSSVFGLQLALNQPHLWPEQTRWPELKTHSTVWYDRLHRQLLQGILSLLLLFGLSCHIAFLWRWMLAQKKREKVFLPVLFPPR